jgi:hypothetical protein
MLWWAASDLNMLQANGFSLLYQNTFWGFRLFLWGGALIDSVFVFAFAAGMSWGWKRLSSATDKERFWKSVSATATFFLIANSYLLRQEYKCFDCMHAFGFPLFFYEEGGFLGLKIFLWRGVVVDLFFLLVIAAGISWGWKRFYLRRHKQIAA